MYHPSIVSQRVAALAEASRLSSPREYSVAEVSEWVDRLAGARGPKGEVLRELSREESQFVTNERIMGVASFAYWAERYAYCSVEGAGIRRMFPLFDSQKLILEEQARVEKEIADNQLAEGILLNVLKARRLGCCLAPETRVLTADLRWIPLSMVGVGSCLLAFDEDVGNGRGVGRKLRVAVVEAQRVVKEVAFELLLADGTTLVASGSHRFLTYNRGGVDLRWRRVDRMVVGDDIRRVAHIWSADRNDADDGWFGGIVDGEGHLRVRTIGGVELSVSQNPGPVWDRIVNFLQRGGFTFHVDRKPRTAQRVGNCKASVNRTNELFELLGRTRPTRYSHPWWVGMDLPGCRREDRWVRATVVGIRRLGLRRLIDLQTSTGTFVAEGMASHNSTLSQAELAHRLTTQTYIYGVTAADVPEQSSYNFGMFKLIYQHLPWYMKPELASYSNTYPEEYAFSSGSQYWCHAGQSTRGTQGERGQIGRGKGVSVCHLTELATWEDTKQIDSSLLPIFPTNPRTLVIFESSPRGRNNWWHQHWTTSTSGIGRFTPVFLPWYAEPRKYRKSAPAGWLPADSTLAHARRCEEQGPRWLHKAKVELSRDQLYWYEQTRAYYEAKKSLQDFLQEYAADPEECFVFSGRSLITQDVIQRHTDLARPLLGAFEIAPKMDVEKAQRLEALAARGERL